MTSRHGSPVLLSRLSERDFLEARLEVYQRDGRRPPNMTGWHEPQYQKERAHDGSLSGHGRGRPRS